MDENSRSEIWIIKLDHTHREAWRYPTRLIERQDGRVKVEGFFDRDSVVVADMVLRRGDRFIETYYSRRWYNVLEIYDRESQQLKGWYCNATRPAEIRPDRVTYVDLGLDLLVYPDGRQVVLDEDEFQAMVLSEEERRQARLAIDQLRSIFNSLPPRY